MLNPPAFLRLLLLAAGLLASAMFIGCTEITPTNHSHIEPTAMSVVTTDKLLSQSAAAHQQLSTLRATGVLRDYRQGGQRVVPIQWTLMRPDRCRLQIDLDVTIVQKDQWWTYRADSGRFRSHRPFSRTPIETAGSLLSDGVTFLLPALFLKGEGALEKDSFGRFSGWRLLGAGWLGTRPCYVFERSDAVSEPASFMRLYLDQASLLLRGWSLESVREDGVRRLILEVRYTELTPNATMSAETFQAHHPQPLVLPDGPDHASAP